MDLYGADDKQRVYLTYNIGHRRSPVDVEYVSSLPNDRRRLARRRAHHFAVLSLLSLFVLLYWNSGKSMTGEAPRKTNSGCSGTSAVKLPQYYPAGVTPEVAAILPSFNWTAVRGIPTTSRSIRLTLIPAFSIHRRRTSIGLNATINSSALGYL